VSDSHSLIELIHQEIQANGGQITFARYMEMALYAPKLGYYTKTRTQIGKEGDYYTSVSVGSLLGRLLAKQLRQFQSQFEDPSEFEVIEFGGHSGQLREDILAAAPELQYQIIENADPIPEKMKGCVLSNEFLDALPVHRVCVREGAWQEIYVGVDNQGDFVDIIGPLSTPRLAEQLAGLPVQLMEGYRTEINLRALDWIAQVGKNLERGYVLTIDYGFERNEFFAPHRRDGTLQCYHQHTKTTDPYQRAGAQDITTHVEFTSVMEEGKKHGLETVKFTDQSHYLLEIGEELVTEIVENTAGTFSKERAAIHQLMHPGLMGTQFKVLIQRDLLC